MTMCHLWPGITPFNVWQLQYYVWFRFASAADAHEAAVKKANDAAAKKGAKR